MFMYSVLGFKFYLTEEIKKKKKTKQQQQRLMYLLPGIRVLFTLLLSRSVPDTALISKHLFIWIYLIFCVDSGSRRVNWLLLIFFTINEKILKSCPLI